ncbi:MAG: hypothetical protein ABIB93_06370 [Chloroflexota bacterium]
MWSIVGLVGLFAGFLGACMLAVTAIKNEGEILSEGTVILPSGGPPGSEEYEKSIRNMPKVQALFRQSKVAKYGLWIMTAGFLLQFSSALALFICPQ